MPVTYCYVGWLDVIVKEHHRGRLCVTNSHWKTRPARKRDEMGAQSLTSKSAGTSRFRFNGPLQPHEVMLHALKCVSYT